MPATKKSSKKKSSRKAPSDMVVPGYTRSSGAYMRFNPLGPELKWKDTDVSGAIAFGLASRIDPIANVAQGTEPFQRIGRCVTIKSVEVKLNIQAVWSPTQTAPFASPVSYRVDLILDKQANGALPAGADIYDTNIAAVDACNRFLNLYNTDRFVLVKRWEGDLNPSGFPSSIAAATASRMDTSRDLKFKKRLNAKMEFSGNTGANAEIRSNNLLLVYTCTCAIPATAQLALTTADSRILFSDV